MIDCSLCSALSSDVRQFWNTPVLETANFVALPSLGSLVEGWLLLLPKTHIICMGALDPSLIDEMEHLKAELTAVLQNTYGPVCAFEHGPCEENREVGCSVDHAHLHIVPIDFDLAEAASFVLSEPIRWHESAFQGCRDAFRNGYDYMYLEQPLGAGRLATNHPFGSQLFRKAIATHLGVPQEYNWRDHPHTDVVAKTIEMLSFDLQAAAS